MDVIAVVLVICAKIEREASQPVVEVVKEKDLPEDNLRGDVLEEECSGLLM